jgi:hypothetical protein
MIGAIICAHHQRDRRTSVRPYGLGKRHAQDYGGHREFQGADHFLDSVSVRSTAEVAQMLDRRVDRAAVWWVDHAPGELSDHEAAVSACSDLQTSEPLPPNGGTDRYVNRPVPHEKP